MDDKWFKQRQKIAGVTAGDIAREAGRARSNISHIYSGKQKMSLDWAQAFAKMLDVSVDEVLRRAGALPPAAARPLRPGYAESDAIPFEGSAGAQERAEEKARVFGGSGPGVNIWTVKSPALALGGYLPGDVILVDTGQSERAQAGDVVIAEKFDRETGLTITMLRRYEPPVLVAASAAPTDQRVHVVDTQNVVIKGRVIASWRETQ
ncbi:helix-turn-helix domain-containing protein [Marinovum algicola]|uniref:LexA family transcriptional regulator n=1 Tax=Marinovum algicola TaxID=42444 RepID=UPI003B521F1E